MRLATISDLERIIELRHDAARWLASLGSDQWSDAGIGDPEFTRRVSNSIKHSETWIAQDEHGNTIGTIAVDHWSDPHLWSDSELTDALIVHRMIIDRQHTGLGIGKTMLNHADKLAAEQGRHWLRLDAWTTNENLHHYYQRAGFRHVRTAPTDGPSTALFERPVIQAKN